jgi:hypothetical protein
MIITIEEAQGLTARAIKRGWIKLAETVVSVDDEYAKKRQEERNEYMRQLRAKRRPRGKKMRMKRGAA